MNRSPLRGLYIPFSPQILTLNHLDHETDGDFQDGHALVYDIHDHYGVENMNLQSTVNVFF